MHLEGWNSIPQGSGAYFDVSGAPWWLRTLFRSPVVDRFAYPLLVSRGYGWLTAVPDTPGARAAAVARGWRIADPPDAVPGWHASGSALVTEPSPTALQWRRRRYALAARRRRVLRRSMLPAVASVRGRVLLERRNVLAWRVRGPLLALSALVGRRLFGRAGWLLGMICAVAAEMVFSYRWPHGPAAPRPGGLPPDGGDDGSAGVREPRNPLPVVSAGAAPIP